ncbi:MAG TPA: hypothetical protein VJI68_01660 [Candidatus Nanoarchaeia archaeon]|nr:hypothetical protein [Candidatus Nanoarchaeia archaeon]
MGQEQFYIGQARILRKIDLRLYGMLLTGAMKYQEHYQRLENGRVSGSPNLLGLEVGEEGEFISFVGDLEYINGVVDGLEGQRQIHPFPTSLDKKRDIGNLARELSKAVKDKKIPNHRLVKEINKKLDSTALRATIL